MRTSLVLLGLGLAAVAGAPSSSIYEDRIMGGTVATIEQYPFQAAILVLNNLNTFTQICAGTILNERSILTAAHCIVERAENTRVRVGSSFTNTSGVVHQVQHIIVHEQSFQLYPTVIDMDFAILRLASPIVFNNQAQPAAINDGNYIVADNEPVWAIGWGKTWTYGQGTNQLRKVQLRVVNQDVCRALYAEYWPAVIVNDNMLCAGMVGLEGMGEASRNQCEGDSGGPLITNRGLIIGVASWGNKDCVSPHRYPGVNARVSRAYGWIQRNK